MQTSRVSAKGQVTIPKDIRKTIGVKPGDLIAYEVRSGVVTLRRVEPFDRAFHAALADTLTEWGTAHDEEAYRDL
jgi:AbrB family looped-hinge helix DNA binding protein